MNSTNGATGGRRPSVPSLVELRDMPLEFREGLEAERRRIAGSTVSR
ncbi:hypothetical protein GT204_19700 [Streptomyces sp. SID4919]|nr:MULTISPECIES: hypothetical protein [unclassified Streptomyces]MYY11073.1 hypothetical protein [Streptomyces sp. SID4919]